MGLVGGGVLDAPLNNKNLYHWTVILMKMKEVCKRTGLTERAVRFYVSEGLVAPESQNVRGRTYIEFSDDDVETLQAVAVLRNAQFTVAEIRQMQQDKNALVKIPSQAACRLTRIAQTAETSAALLSNTGGENFDDIVSLAKYLSTGRVEPFDPKPNFGKLDGVTKQERDEAFEKFIVSEEKRKMKNRRVLLMLSAVVLVVVTVFATLLATGQLKKDGTEQTASSEFIEEYPLSELGEFTDELRAYIPHPAESFSFKTVGVSGIDGSVVTVYTNGEKDICLWGRKLNESEALAAADLEREEYKLSGNAESPESRLEAIIPGIEDGEYYVLWIESDTVTESDMTAVCAKGVNILTPWGEEIEILP